MVPSIPRRGGLRNRTEPNIHRNTYEVEFQEAQVISKSTVPLNRHATTYRFTIPTPKQQDTTKQNVHIGLIPYHHQRKRRKSKENQKNIQTHDWSMHGYYHRK